MDYKTDCLHFNGYKPCKFKRPCPACPHYQPVQKRILIISLEAMGAVLRSTCILEPISKAHPNAHITWVTLQASIPLLENNPFIHRLMALDQKTAHVFSYLEFDILYAVDKSIEAGALAEIVRAKQKYGFGLSPHGTIRPLTEHANYQFDVGLNDDLKFRVNQQAETQQTTEALGLNWERAEYSLHFTPEEQQRIQEFRKQLLPAHATGVIGFNTGCSVLFPYKKFTVDRAIETVRMWRTDFPAHSVALLGGGPQDKERQDQIKSAFSSDHLVINTPTNEGLRAGMLWIGATDLVFSGCTLGLHIAIAQRKPVIAWFGVSCIQEVDIYGRGTKIQANVTCSPCWKRSCSNEPKCYNSVPVSLIADATREIIG